MKFLLYGAYGYTGSLIAHEAARRGYEPILAGRDPAKLAALVGEVKLPHQVIDLSDQEALEAALEDVPFVLHCAGPFQRTAEPMVRACLRTGTHYLDITGEIQVFEMLAALDDAAKERGVMLLPGVGFDVVPTDCLGAHLKERVPDAKELEIAFMSSGSASRGTMKTMIANLGRGGAIRRDGAIQKVPPGWRTRLADFGKGPVPVISIPWGDVSTAYHSTGIPNITTYVRMPSTARRILKLSRYLEWLLKLDPVKQLLTRWVDQMPAGPDEEQRTTGRSNVWGEVTGAHQEHAIARLSGPEGYTLTMRAALAAAERVADGAAKPGFQTPSSAFGADFVLNIEGVEREDVA